MKNVGDIAREIEGLDISVPALVNGLPLHNVFKDRNAQGDIRLNLVVEGLVPVEGVDAVRGAEAAQEAEARRHNNPAELTDEEKEQLRLTEKLAGVPERRADPDDVDVDTAELTPAEKDAVAQDLGDQGSEKDAL